MLSYVRQEDLVKAIRRDKVPLDGNILVRTSEACNYA